MLIALRLTLRPTLIRPTLLPNTTFKMDNSTLASRITSQAGNAARGGRSARGRGRGRGRGFATTAQRAHASVDGATLLSSNDVTPTDSGSSTPALAQPSSGAAIGYLSEDKFADLKGKLDPRLLSAIPFTNMSPVQAATIPTALSGKDVLAQAKTGTGKTLAFLIPAIQALCSLPRPPLASAVSVLVLSPTRELAMQIEKEAHILLSNLKGTIGVQHVVGGTNINAERKRLIRDRKDILIATPGRLLDHLNNAEGSDLNLVKDCKNLRVLVLDEADRMLDMGFRNELEKILRVMPDPIKSDRQALFFSATIPSFVHEVAKLRPNHAFISTLSDEDVNTHKHVPQESLVCPLREVLPRAMQVILSEAARYPDNHKILVFLPTARATALAAAVLTNLQTNKNSAYAKIGPVSEIHSRKSQSVRTNTMTAFHHSPSGVLFSSDVTARGVDIPGVSLVIQLGLPSSMDQYVHRLGRTARAGKQGRGVVILGDFEKFFIEQKDMKRLPITPLGLDKLEQESSIKVSKAQNDVDVAMNRIDTQARSQAYQAHLGFYKGSLKAMGWSLDDLIAGSNEYASQVLLWPSPMNGSWVPPPLLKKTVGMMGLKGRSGLNISDQIPGKTHGDTGRGLNGGGAKRVPDDARSNTKKRQNNGQGSGKPPKR